MLIECVLKRAEPIVVPIGNEKYHFEPDEKGRNVCEVWIDSHIEAFLAVSHLYRSLDGDRQKIETAAGRPVLTMPADRKGLMAALRARNIPFVVTESNEALRQKLTAAAAVA